MRHVRAPRAIPGPKAAQRVSGAMEVPDAELVRRSREGAPSAKEALFRRHVDFITALVWRILGQRDEADDVVQDTFMDAFAGLDRFQETAPFRAWLAGIAVHKVHRRFRRRRLLGFLGLYRSSHDAMLAARSSVDNPVEVRDELRRLDDALRTLPDVDRAAWILRYVEGYSLQETATLTGASLTTAKRRIARAHGAIRPHVDLEEPPDE